MSRDRITMRSSLVGGFWMRKAGGVQLEVASTNESRLALARGPSSGPLAAVRLAVSGRRLFLRR